jgi:tetratricopeptide (TPR) repeat protein
MNILKQIDQIYPALVAWIVLASSGFSQTSSRLSSLFLARGEQGYLELAVTGEQPDEPPEIDPIKDVQIQPVGRKPMPQMLQGRRVEWVFFYAITSYAAGKHTIPAIEVTVSGIKTQTEPIEFEVFNPDELVWSEVQSGGKTIRYASAFRAMNNQPFENETTPVEIKIYVPRELQIDDWGIPDFERDGLAAWRLQPSLNSTRGAVNLLGANYYPVAYPSTLAPTRTGKISIGPAKIRLTTREVVMDPFPRQINPEVYLQVPKLELVAKPLPPGAPEGFDNAVGNFRLTANCAATEVQEGDPITVDLTVSGSGNLDTMRPPKLENSDRWKIYSTTTDQRGDERRQLAGEVVFHQTIRPLELKPEIPPFRLVYFEPKTESYKTLSTSPIALQMTPSPAAIPNPVLAAQSLAVPFERMTDILGTLRPATLTQPVSTSIPTWLGHGFAGLIALGLVAKALWMRHSARLKRDPTRAAKARELREISLATSGDDAGFLRSAGRFIEHWLGGAAVPEIQAVLAERDAVCFRTDRPQAVLNPARRAEILKLLRQATMALALVLTFGFSTTPVRAADVAGLALEAYESAKYDDAIQLWLGAGNYQNLSADTLYNVGNSCYRSGSPGQAALYFRRALARDPSHQEARQNLRFIERKYGAITIERPEYQYALTQFPLATWQALFWGGAWLCGLALLVFPATFPRARLRVIAVAALVMGPILVSIGMLGWRYFPNDAEFAPLAKQAVIIAEKVALHTDAARTSPEVIDAPPGSLCEIIAESGRWVYVAFATKTRGWVPQESIEKVLPDKPPTPPKFRKPKADGKTA